MSFLIIYLTWNGVGFLEAGQGCGGRGGTGGGGGVTGGGEEGVKVPGKGEVGVLGERGGQ